MWCPPVQEEIIILTPFPLQQHASFISRMLKVNLVTPQLLLQKGQTG